MFRPLISLVNYARSFKASAVAQSTLGDKPIQVYTRSYKIQQPLDFCSLQLNDPLSCLHGNMAQLLRKCVDGNDPCLIVLLSPLNGLLTRQNILAQTFWVMFKLDQS